MFNEFDYDKFNENETSPYFSKQASEDNDFLISTAINKMKAYYYAKDFDGMVHYLNNSLQGFLRDKKEMLYLIMKLKFFILLERRDPNANIFYLDLFQKIVKETKGNGFEKKNAFFMKLLNNPLALEKINIITHFENKFMFMFTKELTNFVFNPDLQSMRSQASNDTFTVDMQERENVNNEEGDCNRENEIEDFSIMSTQEELSDDDFFPNAPCYAETENSDQTRIIVPTTSITEVNNINPAYFNPFQDKGSNYHLYKRGIYVPKIATKAKIENKFPLLKQFKPRFTKRENIDKKIIRKFKVYLKDQYKYKYLDLANTDKTFWIMFIDGNLYPPIKFIDNSNNEYVNFKSFNSDYMQWLFNKQGAHKFYLSFARDETINVVNSLADEYGINQDDMKQLDFYVRNLNNVFVKNSPATPNLSNKMDPFNFEDEELKLKFRERSREFDLFGTDPNNYFDLHSDKEE